MLELFHTILLVAGLVNAFVAPWAIPPIILFIAFVLPELLIPTLIILMLFTRFTDDD